jgi:hypothetical protein
MIGIEACMLKTRPNITIRRTTVENTQQTYAATVLFVGVP